MQCYALNQSLSKSVPRIICLTEHMCIGMALSLHMCGGANARLRRLASSLEGSSSKSSHMPDASHGSIDNTYMRIWPFCFVGVLCCPYSIHNLCLHILCSPCSFLNMMCSQFACCTLECSCNPTLLFCRLSKWLKLLSSLQKQACSSQAPPQLPHYLTTRCLALSSLLQFFGLPVQWSS